MGCGNQMGDTGAQMGRGGAAALGSGLGCGGTGPRFLRPEPWETPRARGMRYLWAGLAAQPIGGEFVIVGGASPERLRD